MPISLALDFLGFPQLWIFVTSAIAIIPLAGLIGQATEQVATRVGPGAGGLLNATFGNATELIIAIFALRAGLQEVVKASISGSIIGNVLLVLGLSMLLGGWGRERQTFNRTRAGANAAMLLLAVVALVMPAIFDIATIGGLEPGGPTVEQISILVSIVLILIYAASLVFSLRTHRDLITSTPKEAEEAEEAQLALRTAVLLLLVTTVVVAVESELLVGAIQETTSALGMTQFFVGIVVVAIVGNAAEHTAAVTMAMKNRMELSVTIASSSSTQVALFVAPVLVFSSLIFGEPLSLIFNIFEIAAISLSVLALVVVSLDGESNWFEGLQLVGVYAIMAIVFYFVPAA